MNTICKFLISDTVHSLFFITYWTAKPQAASHTGGSFGAYEIIFVTLQYDSVFQFIIT